LNGHGYYLPFLLYSFVDGLVKSAYAMLRFISRDCGVRTGTPHFSRFARVASEAFSDSGQQATFPLGIGKLAESRSSLHGEEQHLTICSPSK
jgi:hypothetical protein